MKVKLKPWLATALVLVAGVVGSARAQTPDVIPGVLAFDQTAKPLPKAPRVAYLTQCVTNPYCQASLKGLTEASKKFGFEFRVFDAQFNPSEQLKQVQNAAQQKFDGYIFNPTTAAAGCSMWKNSLVPTGKPVVTSDIMMCGDANYTPGTNGAVILQTQAFYDEVVEAAFKQCSGTCTAMAVGGFVGSDLQNIWEASLAKMSKRYSNVKLVVDQPGNFSPQVALRVTQDALRAHPDINLIISSWDDMSRGVIEAVANAGKKPGTDIKIASLGASKDGLDRVRKGEFSMTAITTPYEEGYYAGVAMAMGLAGQPVNGFVDEAKLPVVMDGPKSIIITKENVDKVTPKF